MRAGRPPGSAAPAPVTPGPLETTENATEATLPQYLMLLLQARPAGKMFRDRCRDATRRRRSIPAAGRTECAGNATVLPCRGTDRCAIVAGVPTEASPMRPARFLLSAALLALFAASVPAAAGFRLETLAPGVHAAVRTDPP